MYSSYHDAVSDLLKPHDLFFEFNNEDDFIHQIYIQSPQLNFDSDEQPPGQIITVKFPSAGTYEVHCHIHPKMYLKVDVK